MSISTRSLAGLLCVGLLGGSGGALADAAEAEIEHILIRVGQSQCVFIRNGREHPAADAESHLRMKYRKGARYVDSTEDFIERLASSSSWTKEPYQIRCPGQTETTASVWLHSMLRDYRGTPLANAPPL
jgi:hypothetical protein